MDKAVKTKVSSLTASFKSAHGIKGSKVINAISYFLTGVGNKTAAGRWLGDKRDLSKAGKKALKSYIKEWYNYGGGKQLIKGIGGVLFDVAFAIAGAVAAVAVFLAGALTGGAVIVLAAALIASTIAMQDAYTNLQNERAAYQAQKNGDPATGARRSAINSYSDYLRSSYIFGADGETYEYNKTYNAIANGLDVTETVCGVVTLVSSAGSLLKNGFKWATGSTTADFKQIFTKDGLTNAFTGIKDRAINSKTNIYKAFSMRDTNYFASGVKNFGSDFLNNLNGKYLDFSTFDKGASSVKSILSAEKTILIDGITGADILTKVVLPGAGIVHVPTVDKDSHSMITGDDIYGLIKDGLDLCDGSLLDKLSGKSDINVSIPEIKMPEFKYVTR